jgi:hypothetical protein
MGIRYIHLDSQRKVVAVMNGCEKDCVRKIHRVIDRTNLAFDESKYLINDTFRGVAVCAEEDEYDPKEGEKIAKAKLLDKYHKMYDATMDRFKEELQKVRKNLY